MRCRKLVVERRNVESKNRIDDNRKIMQITCISNSFSCEVSILQEIPSINDVFMRPKTAKKKAKELAKNGIIGRQKEGDRIYYYY